MRGTSTRCIALWSGLLTAILFNTSSGMTTGPSPTGSPARGVSTVGCSILDPLLSASRVLSTCLDSPSPGSPLITLETSPSLPRSPCLPPETSPSQRQLPWGQQATPQLPLD